MLEQRIVRAVRAPTAPGILATIAPDTRQDGSGVQTAPPAMQLKGSLAVLGMAL